MCGSRGPNEAEILIIGEAPGVNEENSGKPFVGASGIELDKMLGEARIPPGSVRYTNVCPWRPPGNDIEAWMPSSKKRAGEIGAHYWEGAYVCDPIIEGVRRLRAEIAAMPNLRMCIPVGNTPLWALTGNFGITKWRGSQILSESHNGTPVAIVPAIHPASVLRSWDQRWYTVGDFKRARRWLDENLRTPDYAFLVRPSFRDVCDFLRELTLRYDLGRPKEIAVDIETRSGHIVCLGIADNSRRAICIPFVTTSGPYWSPVEEVHIVQLLCELLMHPQVHVIGQNYLYDRQYIARRWFFRSALNSDTMVKHHLCFPGVPKGLDFISALYNDFHCYWKDESKDWDPTIGEEQLWIYNCKDAVATWEANQHLNKVITAFGLWPQHLLQMQMGEVAFDMMLRGCKVDFEAKRRMSNDLAKQMGDAREYVNAVLGRDLGIFTEKGTSPTQVMRLCNQVLGLPQILRERSKGFKSATADDEAIEEWLRSCNPLFRPILQSIADYRSLLVYKSTFADAEIDPDGRFRCSINVAGTDTFRFSTSSDAFGYGTNMQNIPKGDED